MKPVERNPFLPLLAFALLVLLSVLIALVTIVIGNNVARASHQRDLG